MVLLKQQAQASKFGNQEGDGNVPNTKHSENVHKHKTSEMIVNPSDTDWSPRAAKDDIPPVVAPSSQTGPENEFPKINDNLPQKHSAFPQRRTTRTSGHEHSVEHSPLHHHQARVANKGGGFSPSWKKKGSSDVGHGIAPNTLGRSRLRVGGRTDESPEDGSAIPKFGEWVDGDPSSADGFTGNFEKVREEKLAMATKVPMITDDSLYLNSYQHGRSSKESTRCFCFNWGKK